MNRRSFLSLFSAGVAGLALEQAIPLGRVWSFPKEIVIAKPLMYGIDFAWADYERTVSRIQFADPYTYAAIRAAGWRFPEIRSPKFTAAFPPDSSHTPS